MWYAHGKITKNLCTFKRKVSHTLNRIVEQYEKWGFVMLIKLYAKISLINDYKHSLI